MGGDNELHASLIEFLSRQPAEAETTPDCVKPLRDIEKKSISEALTAFKYNIKQTSEHLGITRNTLYSKIKQYGICPTMPES